MLLATKKTYVKLIEKIFSKNQCKTRNHHYCRFADMYIIDFIEYFPYRLADVMITIIIFQLLMMLVKITFRNITIFIFTID